MKNSKQIDVKEQRTQLQKKESIWKDNYKRVRGRWDRRAYDLSSIKYKVVVVVEDVEVAYSSSR